MSVIKSLNPIIRIKPFVSSGDVFVRGDGRDFEIVPISFFPDKDGWSIFRVGRTTYWFNADGEYDGPEFACLGDRAMVTDIGEALGLCKHNRGKAPTYSYFAPDTRGYAAETALWPKEGIEAAKKQFEAEHGPVTQPMTFGRMCDCGWLLPRRMIMPDPNVKGVGVECPRCGKQWKCTNEAAS
jgi:hypothetical protein